MRGGGAGRDRSPPRDRYQPEGRGGSQRRTPLFDQRPPRPHRDDEDDATPDDDEGLDDNVRDPPSSSRPPNGSSDGYSAQDDYRRPTVRDELRGGDVLFGVFPILNSLRAQRRKVHALYVLSSLEVGKRKDATALRQVFKLATEHDVPVLKVERHDLNLLSEDRVHQGLVLDCSPLEWTPLDTLPPWPPPSSSSSSHSLPDLPDGSFPIWLALDEVQDPQNFGALVRSAHCLGARGILACDKNCAPLSATTSKASAGVLEVVSIHTTQNMPKTLAQAVLDGWDVLGASGGEAGAVDCSTFKVTKPTILVMGNEGVGLRTNVKRSCSGFLKVEMQPRRLLAADSLNVSVAAGILVHALVGSAADSKC